MHQTLLETPPAALPRTPSVPAKDSQRNASEPADLQWEHARDPHCDATSDAMEHFEASAGTLVAVSHVASARSPTHPDHNRGGAYRRDAPHEP